ncbi:MULTISPECIES: HAD family hydrolase [Amycolatopsis]|uniref:HAD family hydrolase n=1 Tax=Amycolatopsis thermalba TaxID=944492 RepID=A0ABY4P0C0_9PSEU|nr:MULTISPECIES: HAD family hydrolase [Amycolatopsis]OXM63633.1 haloacid dehalogenase [Amycolatopsis sp. KNN50.9b]UQS25731.1 HAD family hydrolase [Amycolatopsis thermalba]
MLLVFDINETLLDLAPLDDVLGGTEARTRWFDLLIHTALVVTASDRYQDFAQLAGACARTITPEVDVPKLAETLRSLPPHPDVVPALDELRDQGHRLVALGNSPQAVIEAQLADLGFDALYSAEAAGALKPSPAAYALVEHDGEPPVMVAAHDWDIAGAQAAGLRTAFVTRDGRRPLPAHPSPEWTVTDLAEWARSLRTA